VPVARLAIFSGAQFVGLLNGSAKCQNVGELNNTEPEANAKSSYTSGVGLGDRLDYLENLSGGQKQRVATSARE